MNKEKVQRLLDLIYTDMLMLRDGEWEPDMHTCQASVDTIEELAKELEVELKDIREDE